MGAGGGSSAQGGRFSYVLAPQEVTAGSLLQSGPAAEIRAGNALPLSAMPVGQSIHNVELYPGRGGQMARAAGTSATLVSKGTPPSCGKFAKTKIVPSRTVTAD